MSFLQQNKTLLQHVINHYYYIFTARIRRMGESNIFSLFLSPHPGGGIQAPGSFPGVWFQVLSSRGIPDRARGTPRQGYLHPRLGYPLARTGLPPPQDRLCCGRYASCGFPQEDFLVLLLFTYFCAIGLYHVTIMHVTLNVYCSTINILPRVWL